MCSASQSVAARACLDPRFDRSNVGCASGATILWHALAGLRTRDRHALCGRSELELAERTLERLSDLFRYALESSHQRTVTLERELALVTDYLELQAARFGSRLRTRISIMHELVGVEVPPLLLQPLVENAILHGASRERGGEVEIAVRREQDRLIIEVSDDGPGPGRSSHTGTGTGVASVAERLRLHYGTAAQLSLSARPHGGFMAQLSLPISSAL